MKGQKSILLFLLALFSLVGIAAVVVTSFLKNKPQEIKTTQSQEVLGEAAEQEATPTPPLDVNKFVQQTMQSTQEVAQEKAKEVQKVIVSTIEKEVSNLTQSQVTALKEQICRDWGVIPAP